MWFRRKKKPDPDNALNETLRSLQNLLEEETSSNQRAEPKITKSTEDLDSDFNFPGLSGEQEKLPGEEDLIDHIVEENQTHNPAADLIDNKLYEEDEPLDPAEEKETIDTRDSHDTSDSMESNGAQAINSLMDFHPDLSIGEGSAEEDQSSLDPFQNEDDPQSAEDLIVELHNEDITQDDIVIPAIDTIPVLNNAVYIPAEVETDTKFTPPAIDFDQLIDATVSDLRERLEQFDLDTMSSDEELALRRTLAQILNNKNTS